MTTQTTDPITLDSLIAALDDAGWSRQHGPQEIEDLRAAGLDYSRTYYVVPGNLLAIYLDDRRRVFAGDDGDGWIVGSEPCDTLEEVLLEIGALEKLTDDMIRTLRDEAGAVGDADMVSTCDKALVPEPEKIAHPFSAWERRACARVTCAEAITAARAMDSRPFVKVVA